MSEGTVAEAETPSVVDESNRRPPNRRALILEAAIQLFHERGYPATSVDDIGSAVDVSGPAIYRHFSSKEEILIEAMILAADEVHQARTNQEQTHQQEKQQCPSTPMPSATPANQQKSPGRRATACSTRSA